MKVSKVLTILAVLLFALPVRAEQSEFFRSDLATHFGVISENSAFMVVSVNAPDVKGLFIGSLTDLPGSVDTISLKDLRQESTRSLFIGFKDGVANYINVGGVPYSRIRGPFKLTINNGPASLEIGSSSVVGGSTSYLSLYMNLGKGGDKGSALGFIGGKLMFNVVGSAAAELRADPDGKTGLTTYTLDERGQLAVDGRVLPEETPIGILGESARSLCVGKDVKVVTEQSASDGATTTKELEHDSLLFLTTHKSTDTNAAAKTYVVAARFDDDQNTQVYRIRDRKAEKAENKPCLAELVR